MDLAEGRFASANTEKRKEPAANPIRMITAKSREHTFAITSSHPAADSQASSL